MVYASVENFRQCIKSAQHGGSAAGMQANKGDSKQKGRISVFGKMTWKARVGQKGRKGLK
jgi:hypothetical protein